jgi:hypothetical protein
MQKTIRRVVVGAFLILFVAGHFMRAQQHPSKSFVYSDGEKTIVDTKTGWTVFDKGGKPGSNITADQLRGTCAEVDKETSPSPALTLLALPCELWAELQPHTQIERVPFLDLIARLFVVTPSSTDFARYRGMELRSTKEGTKYDSTILPSDISNDTSCNITAGNLPDKTFAIYACSIKTSSYQDAIQLEEHLAQRLAPLNLPEDQVEEHGDAAQAVEDGRCAPTGECEGAHVFATTKQNGKMLKIQANPDFTRTVDALMLSLKTGHDLISGISRNSATVSIEVYSVDLKKAYDVNEGKSTSQTSP